MAKVKKTAIIQPYNKYLSSQSYSDDFGYSDEWNDEIDKWLKTVQEVGPSYLENNKNRFKKEKQRDELLAEIKAIYFLKEKLGLDILQLEPPGKDGHVLDIQIKDINDKTWDVEVKAPSWRKGIWDDSSLSEEEKKNRLEKPKYINAEARSFSFDDALVDPIKRSVKQFDPSCNNLLLIVPNMFVTPLASPNLKYSINKLLKVHDLQSVISAVCIINIELPVNSGFKYDFKIIPITQEFNPNS